MTYQSLVTEFESNLEIFESYSEDILHQAEEGINKSEKYIKRLRFVVIKNGFENVEEEIGFFKYLKPQIFSKLIYYVKLFNIEIKRPKTTTKFQIRYLNNHIRKLQLYFDENIDFYQYYRRGATALDQHYFIRGNSGLRLPSESLHIFIDEQFTTSQDITVATIMAYELLIGYLRQEIQRLKADRDFNKILGSRQPEEKKLQWTGSKTDLVELIYSLQLSGSVNGGRADIRELASLYEKIFDIELGNYYHTFIEIQSRKKSRTKYLDRLKKVLHQKFSELDEFQ